VKIYLASDGTHPDEPAKQKVSTMLLNFFKTNAQASIWFTGSGTAPTPTPTSQPPTPTPTCTSPPGDGNGDCSVNGVDYVIWLVNYGRQGPPGTLGPTDGDYFDDDQVNGVDYVVWLTNYTG
jgi:hypothetical protein